ncbi:MAG TPA: LPXTG cell wall anchor domain-containing protein, partial [Candidatus Nanopelagicaceae bacterium]
KVVENHYAGTAVPSDFVLHVTLHGVDVAGSPAVGLAAPGRAYTLAAGSYAVTEDAVAGYAGVFSGEGITTGFVTLVAGSDVTITRTNSDIATAVAVPTPTPTPTATPTPTPSPSRTTVTGGKLPKTASPWFNLLALGAGLILLGGVGFTSRKVLR